MIILTVNSGSSTLKLALYKIENDAVCLHESKVFQNSSGQLNQGVNSFVASIDQENIVAVCHRVVHGGDKLTLPCLINHEVEKEIDRLSALAPLHNPLALKWIRYFKQLLPIKTHQIAVFDTTFFHTLPNVAREYALPKNVCTKHNLRRYGFHGLAHQSMLQQYYTLEKENTHSHKIISLQLGSGCSITASIGNQAMDTSMGFTPMEGLIMSTRCGDIDTGLILYLQQQLNYSIRELDTLLNNESGLLGISSLSGDMRQLLASDLPSAKLAIEMYCYRIKKYIGAFIVVLGGIDAIIFSGGVGENAPQIRKNILGDLSWLGIVLDTEKNNNIVGTLKNVANPTSTCSIWIVPSDESKLLAEQAKTLLNKLV